MADAPSDKPKSAPAETPVGRREALVRLASTGLVLGAGTVATKVFYDQGGFGFAAAQGARQVVLKLGAKGAIVSPSADAARSTVPGHRVNAVDATGAGDCFSGNLLARLAAGDDLLSAARFANAAAALTVQGFGAVASLPRADQVRASGWL